jgi:hypothetical protein
VEKVSGIIGFDNIQNGVLNFDNVLCLFRNRIGAKAGAGASLTAGSTERTLICAGDRLDHRS